MKFLHRYNVDQALKQLSGSLVSQPVVPDCDARLVPGLMV